MYQDNPMGLLVGRRVEKLFLDKEMQSWLTFQTDMGDLIFHAIGDCCSESWFADIIGVGLLRGEVVTAVEKLELPNYNLNDGRGRQDVDLVYGYGLTTRLGVAQVIFRNSSNGYYDGELELSEDGPEGFYWYEKGGTWEEGPLRMVEVKGDYPETALGEVIG